MYESYFSTEFQTNYPQAIELIIYYKYSYMLDLNDNE